MDFEFDRVVFDIRLPAPMWFWFGDIERLSKSISKARPTTLVKGWKVEEVRLRDTEYAIETRITQRRVNLASDEAPLSVFSEYSKVVQDALQHTFDVEAYSRVGAVVSLRRMFSNQEEAEAAGCALISKRWPGLADYWPESIACQFWTKPDSESQVRRSLKVDLRRVDVPGEIDPADNKVALKQTWRVVIELDRFVDARVEKEVLDSSAYVHQTAEDMRKMLGDVFEAKWEERDVDDS